MYQESSQERKRSIEPWLQGITKKVRNKKKLRKKTPGQNTRSGIEKKLKVKKKEGDGGRRSDLNHRESELYSVLSFCDRHPV